MTLFSLSFFINVIHSLKLYYALKLYLLYIFHCISLYNFCQYLQICRKYYFVYKFSPISYHFLYTLLSNFLFHTYFHGRVSSLAFHQCNLYFSVIKTVVYLHYKPYATSIENSNRFKEYENIKLQIYIYTAKNLLNIPLD